MTQLNIIDFETRNLLTAIVNDEAVRSIDLSGIGRKVNINFSNPISPSLHLLIYPGVDNLPLCIDFSPRIAKGDRFRQITVVGKGDNFYHNFTTLRSNPNLYLHKFPTAVANFSISAIALTLPSLLIVF